MRKKRVEKEKQQKPARRWLAGVRLYEVALPRCSSCASVVRDDLMPLSSSSRSLIKLLGFELFYD